MPCHGFGLPAARARHRYRGKRLTPTASDRRPLLPTLRRLYPPRPSRGIRSLWNGEGFRIIKRAMSTVVDAVVLFTIYWEVSEVVLVLNDGFVRGLYLTFLIWTITLFTHS